MAKKKDIIDEVNETVMEEAAPEAIEELIDFDEWYSLREDMIPRQHHREILRADFNARKMPKLNTVEAFDRALGQYGVKLSV